MQPKSREELVKELQPTPTARIPETYRPNKGGDQLKVTALPWYPEAVPRSLNRPRPTMATRNIRNEKTHRTLVRNPKSKNRTLPQ